jgi:ribosomal protein S18 acetylase RimI-like enzyme
MRMRMSKELLDNLDKLHTTAMGEERIRKNLSLDVSDTIAWCKEKIRISSHIEHWGKNWYAYSADTVITVNSHSYTVITAHKAKPVGVREIKLADYSALEDFLYHAIFILKGEALPPREIIFEPEIYVYIKDFGKENDCGVVAEADAHIVGAAWTRIIPAYGRVDANTPELAISVLPGYRRRNIGTEMMEKLFELLRERGYKRTSLSVQQNNPAVRLYKRLGYKITDEKLDLAGHEDYIMIKNLGRKPQ